MHKFGLFITLIGLIILNCSGLPTSDTTRQNLRQDHKNNGKYNEDDSDMLMEPDELSQVSVIRSESRQIFPASSTSEYVDEEQSNIDSRSEAAQNIYPPYYRDETNNPPLGHSRPYINQDIPFVNKFNDIQNPRTFDPSILGSGDFGVIRGGTFYPEDEQPYPQNNEENADYGQFYGDNSNSHGGPQPDSFVDKYTYPEEQFANFRDFADINTPSEFGSSQFVVVYAAKNSTTLHPGPRNIFEQLQLLDKEKAIEEKKLKKTSKSKTKLAKTKLVKKYKKKLNPKDLDYEPLLALS